jgi:hypothetical protein
MSVKISLDDEIIRGRDLARLTRQTREAMLLYDYVTARISIEEFAELMGMPLLDARAWLHHMGVSTSRTIRDPELARSVERDREAFLRAMGLSS